MMSKTKIMYDLEEAAIRLGMVASTIKALSIAMAESDCCAESDALFIPCDALMEISDQIKLLITELFQP